MARTKSRSKAAIVAKARSVEERTQESARLDTIRPHVKAIAELDAEIADYEAAQQELKADGLDLSKQELEDLSQLREQRDAAQKALEEALAALPSEEERMKFLGITRFELVKNELAELIDESQPVPPTKGEIHSSTHTLLAHVDHRLATQEDVDTVGYDKLIFCDCPEHVRDEAGELRTYTVPLPQREGEDARTRRAVGSYFVPEHGEKKSIKNAVWMLLRAGNRYRNAARNASSENASRVLDREEGRFYVKVTQTFPPRDGKPEQVVEDHAVFEVYEDGAIEFLEAGHRLAGYWKDKESGASQIGQVWEKGDKVSGRIAYALLDAANRLGSRSGNRDGSTRIGDSLDDATREQLDLISSGVSPDRVKTPAGRKTKKEKDEDSEGTPKPRKKAAERGGAKRRTADDFDES